MNPQTHPFPTGKASTIKRYCLPLLLLFWLFCLPLGFSIYTPYLYTANCHWNTRCAQLGERQTARRVHELNQFFLHQKANLQPPWTEKENLHMREVRTIYDAVFSLFALVTLVLLLDLALAGHGQQRYQHYARNSLLVSAGLLLSALLLIPFFPFIWAQVFHTLVFDNNLWKTNPNDVSWYLMPKTFFLRVIIVIALSTLLLNLVLWWLCRAAGTRHSTS